MKLFCCLSWSLVLTSATFAGELRYRIKRIDPPEPPGQCGVKPGVLSMAGLDINNRGHVVGEYTWSSDVGCYTQGIAGFFWSEESGTVKLVVPGYVATVPSGINDAGQISLSTATQRRGWMDVFRYTPGVGFEQLPTFGGLESETEDINALGQVTGYSQLPDGRGYPFRYTDGEGLESLGGLNGRWGTGYAINDLGWVTGASGEHAFLFRDDEGMVDLDPGIGYDINNAGVVAGAYFFDEGNPVGPEESVLWHDGQRHLLGRLGGGKNAAHGINNHNVVVGHIWIGPVHASIWTEAEGMLDLNRLVDSAEGLSEPATTWHLTTANAVNDYGQIVGSGAISSRENSDPSPHAVTFRLDPIPPCLSIQRGLTNLTVSWSPAWPGLVLESTEHLSTPDWQAVDTVGTNIVSLPMSGASRFFRLNLEALRGLCCPGMD